MQALVGGASTCINVHQLEPQLDRIPAGIHDPEVIDRGARKEYNWGVSHSNSKITAHWYYIIDCVQQQHDHRLDTHKFIYRRRWRPHIALGVHRPLSPTYNPHKWAQEHRMGLFSAAFVA